MSFFEVDPVLPPPAYQWAADTAFSGLPTFHASIVKYPEHWTLRRRSQRRLVIKETNPLALPWLLREYHPKVIYLVRHPAAVANSFYAKGWTQKTIENRFSRKTISSEGLERFADSFWAAHGAAQAVTLRRTLHALDGYPDHMIVQYEDLCTDPLGEFRRLFDFCDMEWDPELEARICERTTAASPYRVGKFDLKRNSSSMVDKWKTQVAPNDIDEVREGYLAYNPAFYGPEAWRLPQPSHQGKLHTMA